MDQQQWIAIRPGIARLRAASMAIACGVVGGAGLFWATTWLLIRGGPNVGAHLSLLSNYFPGYNVSWGGALLGLFYGALVGATVGYSVSWIYNTVSLKRLDALR